MTKYIYENTLKNEFNDEPLDSVLTMLFFFFKCSVEVLFFGYLFINSDMSSDWRSQVNLRCARQLPSTLHFEQSAKGKKEINSTLTNVNKVLSGQRWRIDSIKRANVPLACLSFNYITESLLHISAPRTSDSPSHQRTYELCGTRACLHVSVDMCVCVCMHV